MKNFWAISAAALAAFVVTGCENNRPTPTPTTWEERLLVTIEERTQAESGPLTLTTTELTYDNRGIQTGETQRVGGQLYYEDTKIEFQDLTTTRYRTIHTPEGEVRQKRVSKLTYIYDEDIYLDSSFEVRLLDADGKAGADPVENYEYTYDHTGHITEYRHFENGVLTKRQWNFLYNTSGEDVTFLQNDGEGDGTLMYHRKMKTNGIFNGDYEIYIGEDIRGILVEKRSEYSEGDTSTEYLTTRYDSEGKNPVMTRVRGVYEWRTVSY